jgi:hypothetical protein
LAQPAIFDVAGGAVTPQDWVPPERLLGASASSTGMVVVHLLNEATATDPTRAEAQTHDASGGMHSFALTTDWGPVTAGTGFLAWTDERHLWVMPSGEDKPTLLLTADDSSLQVQLIANGEYLFWRPVGFDYTWSTNRVAHVACP